MDEQQVLAKQVADWTKERDRLNDMIAHATGMGEAQHTDWAWCYENPHEAAREIDRLRAAPVADSAITVTERMVQSALEAGWNEFVSDTGCYPACFEVQSGKRIEADFQRAEGSFLEYIAASLNASLAAGMVADSAGGAEPTEAMIDAARPLFLALEGGDTSIEDVRTDFVLSGHDISYLPEWFRTGTGHLTKAGRAIIAWHMMQHAAPAPGASPAALTDAQIANGHRLHRLRRDDYTGPSQLCDAFTAGARYAESLLTAAQPPAAAEAKETEQSIAADCYHWIAERIGTRDGYSVQDHIDAMCNVLDECADYFHDFSGSDVGGDDEAVRIAANLRALKAGKLEDVDAAAMSAGTAPTENDDA